MTLHIREFLILNFNLHFGTTPIDPDEAAGLIPRLTSQKELNDFEMLNIKEAVRWANSSRILKLNILEVETLKLVHRRMFGKTWIWAGSYRITQKSIGVEAYKIPTELKQLTDDVRFWTEYGTYSQFEIQARFHHRLVKIHPFPNGNGRHARLTTDLLATSNNWESTLWGSNHGKNPDSMRGDYIRALQVADLGEINQLLNFMFPLNLT